ncbi:acyltransferase family protein [Flavobacterium pedocola]
MSDRLSQKIKNLSFLLMIMVVFLHSYNIDTKQLDRRLYLEKDFNWFLQTFISNGFTRIAVPLFFVISGYLFVYNRKTGINDLRDKIVKRIKTLLIPYLLWTIIGLLVYLILQSIPQSKPFFTNKLIVDYSFLDWVEGIFYKPIPYQLWFLRDLIIMVFLSPLIVFLIKRIRFVFLFTTFLFWFFNQDSVFLSSEALFFFSSGISLALYCPEILEKKVDKSIGIFILWFLLLFFKTGVGMFGLSQKLELFLLKTAILIGLLSFWALYDKLADYSNKIVNQIALVSWTSFFIYVFHEPLLTIIKKALFSVMNQSLSAYLFVYFFSPILTIAISIMTAVFLKRNFSGPYRILTGNR